MSNNHFNFVSRARFDELVENYLNNISPDHRAKAILTQEIVNQAIEILSGSDTSANQRYKHWYCKCSAWCILAKWKLYYSKEVKTVCVRENMYDVICSTHRDLQHAGYRITFEELQHHYSYPHRKLVAAFVNACSICTR